MVADEHVTELLPAYALDALDAGDASRVDAHLKTCPDCRLELKSYQQVVEMLPYSVPQVQPPAYVRERLMEQVGATRSVSGEQRADARAASGRTLSLWSGLTRAWAVVSLVIILALASSNLLLWQRVNRLQTTVQSSMRVINLESTDAAPGASGLLVISLDGEHGTLVVDRLPQLEEDYQYQVWLVENGNRTSGGVFSVSSSGYGSLWVSTDLALADYDSVGITIEPAGGSPGPTGERVLAGEIQAQR